MTRINRIEFSPPREIADGKYRADIFLYLSGGPDQAADRVHLHCTTGPHPEGLEQDIHSGLVRDAFRQLGRFPETRDLARIDPAALPPAQRRQSFV